jgi:hypothetical protein
MFEQTRICKKCLQEFPIENFPLTDGVWRRRKCQTCITIDLRKTYKTQKHRKYSRESKLRWRAKDPLGHMLHRARASAKKHKVPFDLTKEDLQPAPSHCPIFGLELIYSAIPRGTDRSASASLDRLIPSLGYVKGNISIISYRANTIKNDATAKELRAVADWMDSWR